MTVTVKAAARIPVERIRGPVLLLSGSDDGFWPSARFARKVQQTLQAHGHRWPVEHLVGEGAGHARAYLRERGVDEPVRDRFLLGYAPAGGRALKDHMLGAGAALEDLEEAGLLTAPHTSAGRVPSEFGYRTYVQSLMAEEPVAMCAHARPLSDSSPFIRFAAMSISARPVASV